MSLVKMGIFFLSVAVCRFKSLLEMGQVDMIDEELSAVQGLSFGSGVKEKEYLKMNLNSNWLLVMRHE